MQTLNVTEFVTKLENVINFLDSILTFLRNGDVRPDGSEGSAVGTGADAEVILQTGIQTGDRITGETFTDHFLSPFQFFFGFDYDRNLLPGTINNILFHHVLANFPNQ